ncbi:hypothetical protein [Blastococcus aggregatus]|nr:hypothetical protein [Blastococcus aggregatus]
MAAPTASAVPAASPRRGRTWLVVAAVLALVAAGGLALLPGGPAEPARGGTKVVVPLSPVGGEQPDGSTQTRANAYDEVTRAAADGAAGVRVTADLSWLCDADRSCTTAPLDPLVERADELGLRFYLHVNSTPQWMDPRGTWFAPVGPDAEVWAGLFAQLVERFGTRVAGYEVWNEPNLVEAWRQGPDPRQYAGLLKAVWTAADAVDPDAQIIGGILSNNDLGYMHELSTALADLGGNASNRFFYDQLGVHPYAGGDGVGYDPLEEAGSRDVETPYGVKDMTFLGLERLRAQVHADEGIWRDVVVGEFGYDRTPGNWYFVPEPRRGEYLAAALDRAAAWPWLQGVTVYTGEGFAIAGTPSADVLERDADR